MWLFYCKGYQGYSKSPAKNAQTEVIDFDETKRAVTANLNQSKKGFDEFKSCDALKILPKQEVIDFIEFKSFEYFKKYNNIRSQSDL